MAGFLCTVQYLILNQVTGRRVSGFLKYFYLPPFYRKYILPKFSHILQYSDTLKYDTQYSIAALTHVVSPPTVLMYVEQYLLAYSLRNS